MYEYFIDLKVDTYVYNKYIICITNRLCSLEQFSVHSKAEQKMERVLAYPLPPHTQGLIINTLHQMKYLEQLMILQ